MSLIGELVDGSPDVGPVPVPDLPKKPHVIERLSLAENRLWCSCLQWSGAPQDHRAHRRAMGLPTPGPDRPVGRRKRVKLVRQPKRARSVASMAIEEF